MKLHEVKITVEVSDAFFERYGDTELMLDQVSVLVEALFEEVAETIKQKVEEISPDLTVTFDGEEEA